MIRLLTTFFYVGYFPIASGSLASVCGLLLAVIFSSSLWMYSGVILIFTALGLGLSGKMEEALSEKDPPCVVIDEVVGMMIALFGITLSPARLITAFFLFRAFDMFKIYPVQRFEKMDGAYGIMFDDIVAGFYTNLIMRISMALSSAAFLRDIVN